MTQISDLGQLQKVHPRAIWNSEPYSFTPWLASESGLALLGDTIGLELELDETEKNVGTFSADIVCKDTSSDSVVLIENQLEATDHTHLGQLMTYAAGLDAVTIVWVADKFRAEHRAALDWLNEITNESANFFGLEIEVWSIGNSLPAPKFNIISQPNDWVKTLKAIRSDPASLTNTRSLYLRYWTEFSDKVEQSGGKIKARKPSTDHWMNFAVGRSGFALEATISAQKNIISSSVLIKAGNKQAFYLLKEQLEEIESEFGQPLKWHELPTKKSSYITLNKKADPSQEEEWTQQHSWLIENLERFYEVFSTRIKSLNL